MTTDKSTSKPLQTQETIVNDALNLRQRYFRSIGGTMALACFESVPIADNPYFIEIDEIEFKHLSKELES